ncbi:MAG: hypothetical protein AAGA87_07950 [Pseudomonadota bacterium]
MTIGIAATGPWSGAGILAGLRAVEAIGRGAIGGFVSLAVLTTGQKLVRAETQTGGTQGLFADLPPEEILDAPFAALISSGPNRPSPLSQFVAAAPGIGLVTGHRFPHVATDDGHALNDLILDAMRRGVPAQDAIDHVVTAHPGFDAGFIALSAKGDLGLGNMPSVLRLSDQGAALRDCPDLGASVATLHNAVHPSKAIATVANEVVLDEIRRRDTPLQTITLVAGTRIRLADKVEIHVDGAFKATGVTHPNSQTLKSETSFGMGDRVRVVQFGKPIGWLGFEPYMVVKDGVIASLDGKPEARLPVHLDTRPPTGP